jgi:hypothetical protein
MRGAGKATAARGHDDAVPVHHDKLAVILQLAESALGQCLPAVLPGARQAVEYVRTVLDGGVP